jgi:ketosteroid isomerase-like protein
MLWRRLDTAPIDIDTGVEPAIAHAVATMKAILTLIALACVVAGCAHRPEPPSVASVMQADRDFAARAAAAGMQAAFVEYAAPDAVIFRAGVGPIRGSAAIGEAFAGTGNATLAWEPAAAEVAASGELAYTWGWYTFSAEGKSSTGNYVSVWRLIDGRWRYVIDLGVSAPRPR